MSDNRSVSGVIQKNRYSSIDIMRVVGTFLTMMAHVLPPNPILQVRTFDVVMLVFISGICSFKEGNISSLKQYVHYIIKRIRRLVIPTYVLLVGMITVFYMLYTVLGGRPFFWSFKQIVDSFMLLDGVGYVWIVRVYLLMALIIPFIAKLNQRISTKSYAVIGIVWSIVLFCINGISSSSLPVSSLRFLYENYFVYLLGYGFVIFVSMAFTKDTGNKNLIILVIINFVICQIMNMIKGYGFSPADYKYPPSLYYISYGLLVSVLVFSLLRKTHIHSELLLWLSKNSFNIYILHIPCIVIFNSISKHNISFHWVVMYILVVLCASLATRFFEVFKTYCKLWIRRYDNGKSK